MQLKDLDQQVFSNSLALAFLLGVLYAMLVRWVAKKDLEGQTAWAVAVGVVMTLLAMIPTLGLETVAIVFCFFTATGIPMIVEYVQRVHSEKRRDKEGADELAKDILK